jgi:hypothetical protein
LGAFDAVEPELPLLTQRLVDAVEQGERALHHQALKAHPAPALLAVG